MMGIGADDIFLEVDTWRQVRNEAFAHPGSDTSFATLMTHVLKRAGKAMACTSLTTFVAFMTNVSSSFPAIATFGAWCALFVFVNYIAVMTFYPTVIAVLEAYAGKPGICCKGQGKLTESIFPSFNSKSGADSKVVNPAQSSETPAPVGGDDEHLEMSSCEKFFHNKYYPCLRKTRFFSLAIFMVISVVLIVRSGAPRGTGGPATMRTRVHAFDDARANAYHKCALGIHSRAVAGRHTVWFVASPNCGLWIVASFVRVKVMPHICYTLIMLLVASRPSHRWLPHLSNACPLNACIWLVRAGHGSAVRPRP